MRIVCVTRRRLALSLLYSEYLSARKHGAGLSGARCQSRMKKKRGRM
jgi:hypothetical protein